MTARSILLVAHVTPPTAMSAARRAGGLTRYLTALGHRVTILTSTMGGSGPVPHARRTVRTRDLITSRLNWRRGSMSALQGESASAAPAAPSAIAAWVAPDLELIGWLPFALPRALSIAAAGEIDCVITSSPPASGHLIGLLLQARGVPWVADFRDGWSFESQRPAWVTAPLESFDRALERLVVSRADGVCTVTEPISADLSRRFGRPVETITNGFDPDQAPGEDPRRDGHGPPADGPRTLVHTGTLTFGGRPLGPLLAALQMLRSELPDLASRLQVRLIGPATEAERIEVRDAGLDDVVSLPGPMDHGGAVAAQRAADGLLVITGPGQTGVATGKLFEYLRHERPILVIGDETAAASIVRRTGAGVAVDRDSPDELATALRTLIWRPEDLPRPGAEAAAAFAYPAIAEQMAALVETAVQRRRGLGADPRRYADRSRGAVHGRATAPPSGGRST